MALLTVYSVLAGVCLIALVSALSTPNNVSTERKKASQEAFKKHYKRVQDFKCSLPRPTSVDARLLLDRVDMSAVYLPPATVLHRCDAGAGCCLHAPPRRCGVVEAEFVDLTFVKTATAGPSRVTQYISVKAENHTRCGCVEHLPPR